MNEFLLDLCCFHPSLVSSLKLPHLFSLSEFPSLSVRIPAYLSEQGKSDCCRAEDRKKERKKERKKAGKKYKRRGIKIGRVGGTKGPYLKSTNRKEVLLETNLERTESQRQVYQGL